MCVAFGREPLAASHERPPTPVLRVVASHRGVPLFERLTAMLPGGLGMDVSVKEADPRKALRDFCRGSPDTSPDIIVVTLHMHDALLSECTKNGFTNVSSIELGRSALVLAVRSGSALSSLTSRQVYLAIAREVPCRD